MSFFRLLISKFALAAFVFFIAMASDASAQTRVRVIRDQTTVWNPGFATAAAVVKAGTELEAVARRGNWYQVVLPPGVGTTGAIGFVAVSQVELISGPPPPLQAPTPAPTSSAVRPVLPPPGFGVRGFGQVGMAVFDAHQSFSAVFGQPVGLFVGAGGEVRISHLFIQGTVQRFQRTGDRVFAFDGNAFKLGIPNTITITPIALTIGWRLGGRKVIPYLGVGVGQYRYTETSPVGDPSENVDDHFRSYHVLVGGEWRSNTWLASALEVQYTHVPGALNGGVAASFDEHNLGSLEVRVKVAVGK